MSSFPHHSCLDACLADAAGRVAILSNSFLWIVYITCVWRLQQSVGLQHGDDKYGAHLWEAGVYPKLFIRAHVSAGP